MLVQRFGRAAFDVDSALEALGPRGGGLLQDLYHRGVVRMASDGRLILAEAERAVGPRKEAMTDAARIVLEQARHAQAASERQLAEISRRLEEIERMSAAVLASHRRLVRGGLARNGGVDARKSG